MRRYLARGVAIFMLAAVAAPLAAHPHVFVATGIRLELDAQGQLKGIEVAWQYDELYSLLVLEDMALDDDYDGRLTPAELARLDGFDLQWIDGFEGDLYLTRDGAAIRLGPPEARGAGFDEGRITSRHYRPIAGGAAQGLTIQAFDPTYYTAYDLGLGIELPEGCAVQVTSADVARANALVEAALGGQPADPDDFPELGEAFADRVEVSCAAPS